MTEKFIIEGSKELKGEIEVNGSKNAAGPILAATLLTNEECIIDNLPKISDIFNLLDILKTMGAEVDWVGDRKVKIRAGDNINPEKMDFEKMSKTRVSVLLIGALLPKFKKFKISRPGGDRIGLRPITTHLEALRKLGVEFEEQGEFYCFNSEKLGAQEVVLSEFSVTATENLIMVATLSKGETIIKGAACEPHIQDLIKMLNNMGADIKGLGTHTLKIKGVEKLKGVEHKLIPDYIEAGTFISIGAVVGENIKINNIISEHLDLFLAKLKEIGVRFEKMNDSVKVWKTNNLNSVRVQALPYPGFPTDLLPIVVPLLTQAKGKSLIHDPLYPNRFSYVDELRKMGADIERVDPHRAFVFGQTPLRGMKINSWDIRAGASLVIAGLMAEGQTTIENINQIDRGYEKIEERLQKIGADIKRVSN